MKSTTHSIKFDFSAAELIKIAEDVGVQFSKSYREEQEQMILAYTNVLFNKMKTAYQPEGTKKCH